MKSRTWEFVRNIAVRGVVALVVAIALLATMNRQSVLAASFAVNSTADTVDASPGNGVCADASNACTLRAAIMEANALAGPDTITVPAGTYTLTRAGSDDTAINGDLDVTGPITINGGGQGSTIIQAGTTNSNGIDKIFSFNPLGAGSGFAVSVSDLTLRYGKNPETYVNGNGFGGCFDFDSGTSGVGSLSMTHVTVTDCQTTDGDGGGGAIFLTRGSGAISISGTTVQNNTAHRPATNFGIGGGLFFGCAGGSGATVTMSGTNVSNNHAQDNNAQGGGIFLFGACSGSPALNYQMHNVTISGNLAANDGGGIYSTAPLTIDNSGGATLISNNSSGRNGGGIWLNHTNGTSNITKVTISGNNASSPGGGIYLGTATTGNALNLSFSRVVNNTSGGGGSGLSVAGGTANSTNNWWGCSTGPSAAPCDTAQASGGSLNFTPWLRVLTTASPQTIATNQTSSLAASVNTNSNNQDVSANVDVLNGLPVAWSAVGGGISGAQATIQPGGTATATYTASAAQAGNLAAAKVDNDGTTSGSNVAAITVNKADTTTAITSDTPDPSVTGQPVTVNYHVTSSTGGTPTAPSGNVTVSDGTNSCTGSINGSGDGTCNVAFTSAGSKSLTATYAGDANFNGSSSTPATAHTVNKADTTTAIASDSPDPSVVGQSVTVHYSVSVNAPGAGAPTGNVTVSDGTVSCTGTVAAGQCSVTFTSAGAKSLSATYAGDANFNGSTSAAEAHQVNKADTTTTITSDNPDPSNVGQAVTVNFTVTPAAPGAGTPTGSVTVSDGVNSCTGAVSGGTCSITLTTPGAKTLTATYAGDNNFNGSTSGGEPHTVDRFPTTTNITVDTPDPSVVGQSVNVQYGVSAASGTPTGNVTVSDGTVSCTATVAAGQCSLTFTSAGAKSLTATYAGDTNYLGSTSAAEAHSVNKADTTTTITQDNPDPSSLNQVVTVKYNVVVNVPGAGTPTGNVTVSDGTMSCTGTVAAGQCDLTFTTSGTRTLTATYAGDSNFNGSTSAGESHGVIDTTTSTTITSDAPDPSVVGQSVPVQFTVTSSGGAPTGSVTVSDGTISCTATVAASQCSLTFTSAGARSLTASYAGDGTFQPSTSAAAAHQVNKADTTTTITSDSPDPSQLNAAVTVKYTVLASSPGAGTPTGNVTVSDGVNSCSATAAAGQCSITLTTSGARTLTATNAGDTNFNGSTSAGEPHTVGSPTSTTITSDNPDPSVVGQAVTVQYSVTPTGGTGTPTGNVTVSDGTISCTGTVAAGQCSLTFTTAGAKSLTATYAGDSTFNGSTSTPATHTVNPAPTTLLYNGDQIVILPNSFNAAALLSSSYAACAANQSIAFTLDRNPTNGTTGSYLLGTATANSSGQATKSVSTSGWQEGVYTIIATFAGTTNCTGSSYAATLTVGSSGDSANGGGWYTLSGSGRSNFGFTVSKVVNTCTSNCAYKGQLVLINNSKWRLKGTLSSYIKTSTGTGAASGTGDLFWWNSALNGGLGDWALAQSGVSFTANFFDNGKTGKLAADTFGINIQYTPVSPQPSTLPNSTPQPLKGGNITVK